MARKPGVRINRQSRIGSSRRSKRIAERNLQYAIPNATHDSLLLNLPPEMRNRIYDFCLVDRDAIVIPDVNIKTRNAPSRAGILPVVPGLLPVEPGLLKTCRQLREEGTSVYYSANTFQSVNRTSFHVWLNSIGKTRSTLLNHLRGFSETLRAVEKAQYLSALLTIAEVESEFADLGVPTRKGIFHFTITEGQKIIYLNEVELKARMTAEEIMDYEKESERRAARIENEGDVVGDSWSDIFGCDSEA